MEEKLSVDPAAYAKVLERQRNAAFNEAALLSAALDQTRAENEKLKAQIAELKVQEKV